MVFRLIKSLFCTCDKSTAGAKKVKVKWQGEVLLVGFDLIAVRFGSRRILLLLKLVAVKVVKWWGYKIVCYLVVSRVHKQSWSSNNANVYLLFYHYKTIIYNNKIHKESFVFQITISTVSK